MGWGERSGMCGVRDVGEGLGGVWWGGVSEVMCGVNDVEMGWGGVIEVVCVV